MLRVHIDEIRGKNLLRETLDLSGGINRGLEKIIL
jgi:hypothetical protein